MRVYVDTCCFSVVTKSLDVPQNTKALSELRMLLFMIENGHLSYVHSGWLDTEISQAQPESTRRKIRSMIPSGAWPSVGLEGRVKIAARKIEQEQGFDMEDARHLASAIEGKVDFLITFDKDFFEKARQNAKVLPLEVLWLPDWFSKVFDAKKTA